MRHWILASAVGLAMGLGVSERARAYDIDCAIMLCMAGGFPPSPVCARAYQTMIRRILPWPSQPPFGICTYAALPVSLGGPGGEAELDTDLPEFAWLNQTHVIWFSGRSYRDNDDDRRYTWTLKSCDRENRSCHYLSRVSYSRSPWPETFLSDGGQALNVPSALGRGNFSTRMIMVEYGDQAGVMDHSDWYSY